MKKGLIILFILVLLCGCKNKDQAKEDLKVVTNSYYEKYVSGHVVGLDTLEITLGELRQLDDSELDLSSLKKYNDDTKVSATIKNDRLVSYDIYLKK